MQPCDRLTAKEIQVAMLVWEGQTNREIANVVGTTEQVIKNYLRNTFDKLGVWSRLELALYVAAHGGARWRNPPVLLLRSQSLRPHKRSSRPPSEHLQALTLHKSTRMTQGHRDCHIKQRSRHG
jgi:DNA-binding CsgD family transcriptional regulator